MKSIYKKKTFSSNFRDIKFVHFNSIKKLPPLSQLTSKNSILKSIQSGKRHLFNRNKTSYQYKIKKGTDQKDLEIKCETPPSSKQTPQDEMQVSALNGLYDLEEDYILQRYQRIIVCQNKVDFQLKEIKELEKNSEIICEDFIATIQDLSLS